MFKNIKNYIYEPKSKIDLAYTFLVCMGAISCSYLTTMLLSVIIIGDYANKIIPSIILTPILMSIYALWLLFSKRVIDIIKKIFFTYIFLIVLIYLNMEVF